MSASKSENSGPHTAGAPGKWVRAIAWLTAPVDAASLAVCRMLFGFLMLYSSWLCLYHAPADFWPERFYFSYPFFSWVRPLSAGGMQVVYAIMGLASFSLMIGLWARLSGAVLALTYTYGFLLDASLFNNHYYLIILLGLLFVLFDSAATWSVDARLRTPPGPHWVPFWQVGLLRAQIIIVYFYGGVAKINGDWLRGEPMRGWLAYDSTNPLMHTEFAAYFLSYGGLVFDLVIGFVLLVPGVRLLALLPLAGFHVTNAIMYNIGIFPWLALGITIIFFDPAQPRRILARIWKAGAVAVPPGTRALTRGQAVALGVAGVFLAFQLLFPLRQHFYPGDTAWNEFGHRYSWRMKLRDKLGGVAFIVRDRRDDRQVYITEMELARHLNHRQLDLLAGRPEFVLQYAHYLAEQARREGMVLPEVRAHALVSLNGRPLQPLVNPEADLTQIRYPMRQHAEWLLPLDFSLPPGGYPTYEEIHARMRDIIVHEDLVARR